MAMVAMFVFGACANSSVTIYDTTDNDTIVDGDTDSENTTESTDGDTDSVELENVDTVIVDGDQIGEDPQLEIEEPVGEVGCKTDTDCDDGITCTIDECNKCTGTCTNKASDARCGGDPCQVGQCDVEAGGCVFEQLPEGTKCATDDKCAWNECDASGQCVFVEELKIGGMEFCEMCKADTDCMAYVDCAEDHIWGIEHLAQCNESGTCATRVVSENDTDPELAGIWLANCKK